MNRFKLVLRLLHRLKAKLLPLLALATLCSAIFGCGKQSEEASLVAIPPSAESFSVLAGSELKELEPAIQNATRAVGVNLVFSYAGTLDIVERINAGESFDAILPPNGAYPALALQNKPIAREKLFYSRIALGIKREKAASLGWDKVAPTWADIAAAAGSGRLRYGMTNPTSSNTGMSALFAVASALAGKSEDLSVQDVDVQKLKAFLSGQQLTAGSSGWLAEAFLRDPSSVDALINYEAVLLRANEKLPSSDQLTLIYPRDGMISADYPLLLLNPQKQELFKRIVASLKATPFQKGPLAAAYLRPSNPEAATAPTLPTAVVAELSFPTRLEVIDAILGAFHAQWRKPATSIFVLDVSGSMRGPRLDGMREALKVLAGAGVPTASSRYAAFQTRERVVLIQFSNKVGAPVSFQFDESDIQSVQEAVRTQADGLIADGGTAIYSALTAAELVAKEEIQRDPGRLVSIVLLTDGLNNEGVTFEQFKDSHRSGTAARIFPILFGEGNVAEMQALSQLAGGRVFDGRKSRLALVFKEIRGYQ